VRAGRRGLVAIDADARGRFDFDSLRDDVDQGRRGGLEKRDVLNARPLDELSPCSRRGKEQRRRHRETDGKRLSAHPLA
jgi:hypothetical protein